MKLRTVYKIWRTLTFDVILLVLLYFGVILGMPGPTNILIFSSWVILLASIALLFTNDDGVKSEVPRIIGRFFFSTMVVGFVWNAWFFAGALWLGTFLIHEHLVNKYEQSMDNKKDPVGKAAP